ncbi:MAG: hypothetical protein R8M38_04310 [Mariprofundaceae bacterium]
MPNRSQKDSLKSQLHACSDKLQVLRDVVFKKRWDKIDGHIHAYVTEITRLKELCNDQSAVDPVFLQPFKHLHNEQRRVMRTLNEAMQSSSEDIDHIDQGLRRIRRLTEA